MNANTIPATRILGCVFLFTMVAIAKPVPTTTLFLESQGTVLPPVQEIAASGIKTFSFIQSVYSSNLPGRDSIFLSSKTTETAWTNSVGPTPNSKVHFHFVEQVRVIADIPWASSRSAYPICKAQTSFFMSGPSLNALWLSPVSCDVIVQWPENNSPRPSQCSDVILGTRTWVPSLTATATPVYDCLLKSEGLKYDKPGENHDVFRYKKDGFEVDRWYDERGFAWFEACRSGSGYPEHKIHSEKIGKRWWSHNGNCPVWNCTWDASSDADQHPWWTNYPMYFAWFGFYDNLRACSAVSASRTCLMHDTVSFSYDHI